MGGAAEASAQGAPHRSMTPGLCVANSNVFPENKSLGKLAPAAGLLYSANNIAQPYRGSISSWPHALPAVCSMQCASGTTAMFVFLSAPTGARRVASHLRLSCHPLGMGRSEGFSRISIR